jgi:nucleoid-associated protein YgaU
VAATALRGDGTPPVVVRRGDTLWTIAARQLGPDATDAEIAEQWPRWWRANRTRIGDDPDLLLPGQVLEAPTTEASR